MDNGEAPLEKEALNNFQLTMDRQAIISNSFQQLSQSLSM